MAKTTANPSADAVAAPQKDLMVVSYRDHHHAYAPDDANVTFISRSANLTAPRRLLQFVFSMIMVHYFLWIIPMIGSLYFFYRMGAWYISILMLAMYIPTFLNKDQLKSGRPWHAFRMSSLWRLTSRYIGIEVVRTAPLDPSGKYMFGIYPHGILILSRIAMYGGVWEKIFPGVETRVLGASPMFYLPGSREICLWMGAVDAAKRVAVNVFDKFGLSLMVYPGGSDEIFETDPNSPVTTLIVRKGFVKLAIQSGAAIVPGFVFGEKWLYHRKPLPRAVQTFFMKKLRTPLIWFWGRYFSWLPYHDDKKAFLSVVFGKPIAVERQAEPSDELIDAKFAEYIGQIKSIFEEYKDRFGYPANETLVLKEAREPRAKAAAAAGGEGKKKQ